MEVLVGTTWTTTDLTGTAGHIAEALMAEHGHEPAEYTLKADGVILNPGDTVPAGARCEIVAHVPDDAPVVEPEPVAPPDDEHLEHHDD